MRKHVWKLQMKTRKIIQGPCLLCLSISLSLSLSFHDILFLSV